MIAKAEAGSNEEGVGPCRSAHLSSSSDLVHEYMYIAETSFVGVVGLRKCPKFKNPLGQIFGALSSFLYASLATLIQN